MLKYIVAAILLVLVWALAVIVREAFPLGLTIAVGLTALILFVLLAMALWARIRARRAAKELERSILAQAEAQARTVRPEQQAEVRMMQDSLAQAIGSLSSARHGRSGAEALYALPWYVIIGPPGAGKTTALQNSGLSFPMAQQTGRGSVRGVGGTRNCDWWLSNDGVLLDTAGRYTTEDDDREEWLGFLDMLKRARPKKPLNGLLVAISVADLASAHETEIERAARQVRERIDEVQNRLQVVLPVYVLFTKCDLVQGFVEYFGDLKKDDRGQIWGFTVPLERPNTTPGALFEARFDELAGQIARRLLYRLGAERRVESRENIYQFPQQFGMLRQSLREFLDVVFSSNVYQGAPLLRGVYFTSGTQEGRPIDRLLGKMRDAFRIQGAVRAPAQPVTEGRSYFLRDVFARVVFPDQDIAALSPEELARQAKRRYGIAAGAFGLALLVSILPTYSFLLNRDYLRDTGEMAERVGRHDPRSRAPLRLDELEPLRQRVDALRRGRVSPFMGFGMNRTGDLREPASRLYAMALRRHVVEPIARQDVSDLADFADRHRAPTMNPGSEARARAYDALKLHLLVTGPRGPAEPSLDGATARWVTERLRDRWAALITHGSQEAMDPAVEAALGANAAAFVDLLARNETPRLARNAPVVARVRAVMNRVPAAQIALTEIVETVDQRGWDFDLRAAIGHTPDPRFLAQRGGAADLTIPGAFTRRGWNEYVRDVVNDPSAALFRERWVLATDLLNAAAARRQAVEDLRCLYFSRYIAEWRTFLNSVYVTEVGNTPRPQAEQDAFANEMLSWLKQTEPPPLQYLFRSIADNTRLEEPRSAGDAAAGSLTASARRAARQGLARQGQLGRAVNNAAQAAQQRAGAAADTCDEIGDLEATFRGLVAFGVAIEPPRPTPQPGQPPPPPPQRQQTPMDEYEEQLGNVWNRLTRVVRNDNGAREELQAALIPAQQRTAAVLGRICGATTPSDRAWCPFVCNVLPAPMGQAAGARWRPPQCPPSELDQTALAAQLAGQTPPPEPPRRRRRR